MSAAPGIAQEAGQRRARRQSAPGDAMGHMATALPLLLLLALALVSAALAQEFRVGQCAFIFLYC